MEDRDSLFVKLNTHSISHFLMIASVYLIYFMRFEQINKSSSTHDWRRPGYHRSISSRDPQICREIQTGDIKNILIH